MKKLVVFDLDGTLINTIADLGEACNYALARKELAGHSKEEYSTMVGHGVKQLIINALSKSLNCKDAPDSDLVESCLKDFTDYYVAHIDVHSRPYEGMPQLLSQLQANGCLLAVASNKFQQGTELLVKEFFPDIEFVAIMGNSPQLPLKPDAGVIEHILQKAGVSADECLLVGDSPTDMKTAENADIEAIAVSWGYRPKEVLQPLASKIADSPEQLLDMLKALEIIA